MAGEGVGEAVVQVQIPRELAMGEYATAWQYYVQRGKIPIGLYRRTSLTTEGCNCFVYTNPNPETVLHPSDRVFLLQSTSTVSQTDASAGSLPFGTLEQYVEDAAKSISPMRPLPAVAVEAGSA